MDDKWIFLCLWFLSLESFKLDKPPKKPTDQDDPKNPELSPDELNWKPM